jgi:hypothetical protein
MSDAEKTDAEATEPGTVEEGAEPESYPLALVKRETGRQHTVTGQGMQTITDADGNPETEYQLVATVDGEEIKLAGYNTGTVEHLVERARKNREQG